MAESARRITSETLIAAQAPLWGRTWGLRNPQSLR